MVVIPALAWQTELRLVTHTRTARFVFVIVPTLLENPVFFFLHEPFESCWPPSRRQKFVGDSRSRIRRENTLTLQPFPPKAKHKMQVDTRYRTSPTACAATAPPSFSERQERVLASRKGKMHAAQTPHTKIGVTHQHVTQTPIIVGRISQQKTQNRVQVNFLRFVARRTYHKKGRKRQKERERE